MISSHKVLLEARHNKCLAQDALLVAVLETTESGRRKLAVLSMKRTGFLLGTYEAKKAMMSRRGLLKAVFHLFLCANLTRASAAV